MIKACAHQDSEFSGWACHRRGEWVFFEMRPVDSKQDRVASSCGFHFLVRKVLCAIGPGDRRDAMFEDMRAALAASPGGVTQVYSHRTATVDFAEEQSDDPCACATEAIAAVSAAVATPRALMAIARQLSRDALGSETVLYSGVTGEAPAWQVVRTA